MATDRYEIRSDNQDVAYDTMRKLRKSRRANREEIRWDGDYHGLRFFRL